MPTGQRVSHMLAYDPRGQRAYVSNMGSASVSLIDVKHGELLSFQSSGGGAEGIALGRSGRELWVTNRSEDTVSLFDARYLRLLQKIDVPGFPIRAEVTPNGRKVLVTSARSAELSIIDTATREVIRRVSLGLQSEGPDDQFGDSSIPIGIEIAPDGERVWIAHAGADRVQEINLDSWRQTRVFETGREPDAMAYSALAVKR
jgi:YVTN family beta-propeller protein